MNWAALGVIAMIVFQVIGLVVLFWKIAYGQGKAREREESVNKTVKGIETKIGDIRLNLNNHVVHISKRLDDMGENMASSDQRISKIEGYIQGLQNGKN